jgi:hypothetical protein
MWSNQIFSLISEQEIKNVIVADNYYVADQLAKGFFGTDAYAVETTLYPVSIGFKHINGVFYDKDNVEVKRNPTEQEAISQLQTQLSQAQADNAALYNVVNTLMTEVIPPLMV